MVMERGLMNCEALKRDDSFCKKCAAQPFISKQYKFNRAGFIKYYPKLRQPLCLIRESLVANDVSPQSSSLSNKRRLVLLRHAQSSWADRSLKDHDRPLNEHGRTAAASIASKLQQASWLPELILCSDSTRTKETLDIMQKCVHQLQEVEVHFLGSFYSVAAMDGQTAEHLQQVICKYSTNAISTVMCMGHNKGWEEAASNLSGSSIELKTANAALLEAYGRSWEEAFEHAAAGGWKLVSIIKPD